MESVAVNDGGDSPCHPEHSPSGVPFALACIRCGVCCTVYQVRISQMEAQRIAALMGLDYWDWVGRYCDPRWSDPRSHLIRHGDDGCVFLDDADGKVALCRIYGVRPVSCRDWSAGIFKPACQEGLRRFWNVEVDQDGRLSGSPEALSLIDDFLRRL
jgi:hypothetical protein